MSLLARRLVGAAVVLLTLAGATVLGLRAAGAPIAAGSGTASSGSPTEGPSAEGSAVGSTPSATPDAARIFAAIQSQVEAVRGLPAARIGPPDLISSAELERRLRSRFDEDYPAARRATDNIMLRGLGLLGADQDAATLQLELLTGQVIGYYDDVAKQMTVVSDAGITGTAKITYAHEYTHALQDAAFGLATLDRNAAGQDDRDLARTSLIEGDATATMFLWAIDRLSPQELLGIQSTPVPEMPDVPAWMTSELELPYLAGTTFVTQLRTSGGMAGVDAAFHRPPDSTEQVLHPAKYAAREAPVAVRPPAVTTAPGWSRPTADTLGEAITEIWLEALGVSKTVATQAAAGWGGDRLTASAGPNGSFVLGWRLAWDTAADADQFVAAYATARKGLHFASKLVRVTSREVLVVNASSIALVDQEIAAAAP